MFTTLALMALSATSAHKPAAPAPAPVPQQAAKPVQQAETITCPLNGQQIPSCCCPVKR